MSKLTIQECITNSSRWLESIQNKVDGGWGDHKGANSNCLNTAEAIIALLETDENDAGDRVIQMGAEYLTKQQLNEDNCRDIEKYGAWSRNIVMKDPKIFHIPDTVRTSLAILALKMAGIHPNETSITQGVEWLINNQNPDGGWGYTSNHPSQLFPTCMTLKTLLRICPFDNTGDHSLCRNSDLKKAIVDGFEYICSCCRNSDGSFGKNHSLVVPHTLHVIDLLNLAEKQEQFIPKKYFKYINLAIDWIDNNTKDILRWSNETVFIGNKQDSPSNYTFSHINPSLYLRFVFPIILEKVGENFDPEGDLAKYALEATFDNIDDPSSNSHGFCAKRPASWATAHTIAGLVRAKAKYKNFPERELPSTKLNDRRILLGFLLIITFTTTILSILGKLSNLNTIVLLIVILASLLVYGFISEKSFIAMIANQLRSKKDDFQQDR